ncbi:MAG: TadE/TadG family type IV pilus assembly protein [Suipraeoptans sp.]
MLFWFLNKKIQKIKKREERGSYNDKGKNKKSFIKNVLSKKASVFTSRQGSITIEAAVVLPIFIFAVLTLVFLMEAMAIRTNIRMGLAHACKQIAIDASLVPMVNSAKVESYIIESIGGDRLNRSIIKGGKSGIDCSKSSMSMLTGKGKLVAEYTVETPFPMFNGLAKIREEAVVKAWNGYVEDGGILENEDIVYIAETGIVYHKDYNCTYLVLSIKSITYASISESRNENGGKYYECSRCDIKSGSMVYITDYGDKYHGSVGCSGLKRTVFSVPISEAIGKGGCSKCCQ